jgi:hypothetical protein
MNYPSLLVLLFFASGFADAMMSLKPTFTNSTDNVISGKKKSQGSKGASTIHHGGGRNSSLGTGFRPKHSHVENQLRDLFTRVEEECPPGFPGSRDIACRECQWLISFPELCPNGLCCEALTVCVSWPLPFGLSGCPSSPSVQILISYSVKPEAAVATQLRFVNQISAAKLETRHAARHAHQLIPPVAK